MHRQTRILVCLTAAAVAVPLLPWLAWGARLDQQVARLLDPPPAPGLLAVFEVGILAADILLPVPSSFVATLGGASLGVVAGTLCAWAGMTLGSLAGWWLGRLAGGRSLAAMDPQDLEAMARRQRAFGPLAVFVTRPLPLVAEATALMAGATGMPAVPFLAAAAAANLAVAFAWSLAGSMGREADAMQWVTIASLALPVTLAWFVGRRRMQAPAGPV
jgi:uncharacterized membrane protein YdjX (TVP38/TMEM64 family)